MTDGKVCYPTACDAPVVIKAPEAVPYCPCAQPAE